MDYHLVKYIESFLIEWECYHKLDLFSIENKCCICKNINVVIVKNIEKYMVLFVVITVIVVIIT